MADFPEIKRILHTPTLQRSDGDIDKLASVVGNVICCIGKSSERPS